VRQDRDRVRAEGQALVARESRLTEREAVLKRRMDDKLNERLREARDEVDKIVADLKGQAGTLVQQTERKARLSTGDIGGLRAHARAALDSVGERLDMPQPDEPSEDAAFDEAPDPGTRVIVTSFGAEGIVRGVSGKHVEVEVRGKRMRVGLKDLGRLGHAEARSRGGNASGSTSNLHASTPPRLHGSTPEHVLGAPTRDLVLIGSTVDQALDRAEKFLDDALLTDERRLRVVHGHGTGRLRDALREYFRRHPLVANVTAAPDNEGGGGATIVELKD
jgi:DNA mismatch repair protein MutS2